MEPTNSLYVSGALRELPQFSHCCRNVSFSKFTMEVKRESGTPDIIPVIAADALLPERLTVSETLIVTGQLRAYSMQPMGDEGEDSLARSKNRLLIVAFAREILRGGQLHENQVALTGWICRPPVYRMTPLGREIADVFVSVERAFGKSDYLPVIAWGGNARKAAAFQMGECVHITGRLQSRTYTKRLPDGTASERTAYEVSAASIVRV